MLITGDRASTRVLDSERPLQAIPHRVGFAHSARGNGMIARDQTFRHMRIVVNGCAFYNCTFRSCVFVYCGSPPPVVRAHTSIHGHVGSAHGAPHREGEDRRPEYDRDTDDQQPVIPLGPPARRQGRILAGLQEFSIGMLATGCGAHVSGSWLADGRTAETLCSYETTAIAVTFQELRGAAEAAQAAVWVDARAGRSTAG